MPDFNVRSDSVNVEQIMEQIRARIREKRGVDYTEQQIRELAAVKLEKFLDPRSVRSDLLDQFRQRQAPYTAPVVPSYTFEDTTMYETHRGVLRFMRKLLNPLLKLLFNPNAVIHALHTQAEINRANLEREVSRENQRRDLDALYFEVVHNLVLETTRTGIEVKNLKMRVESLASRLEFNERRARALESAVVYKGEPGGRPAAVDRGHGVPPVPAPAAAPVAAPVTAATAEGEAAATGEGPGQRSRRRRRRRGRRGSASAQAAMAASSGSGEPAAADGDADTADGALAREEGDDYAMESAPDESSSTREERPAEHGDRGGNHDVSNGGGSGEPPAGGSSGPASDLP